ncbi:MAG: hypothetical protein HC788_14710 [Sphingopyxis sp.]|nr:hypothetical protein [Sphingopyxis sp.]
MPATVQLASRIHPDDRLDPGKRARGTVRHVTVNLAESPLAWLHARGKLTDMHLMAGERLRTDYERAGLAARDIHIVNTHATATPLGDIQECEAIRAVFSDCPDTWINNTKGFIGHTMGAAGALELAGNLPSFDDLYMCIRPSSRRPRSHCARFRGWLLNRPRQVAKVDTILNNSFGMLGINSTLIVRRFAP